MSSECLYILGDAFGQLIFSSEQANTQYNVNPTSPARRKDGRPDGVSRGTFKHGQAVIELDKQLRPHATYMESESPA